MKLGSKIRERRKSLGLTMRHLARRVGVSYLTIHRVEMDKLSHSVALLSNIAEHLRQSISDFFDEGGLTVVRGGTAPMIESGKLTLRLLAPKGIVGQGISVSAGESQKGEIVSKHKQTGFELTYIIKGKHRFRYGSEDHELDGGDLIYLDASTPHSVTAFELIKFISVYFREKA
jgi:DNA-binding XRE family transcriptional regulator